MSRLGLFFALMAASFALFFVGSKTPEPLPANAPADAFSAERAIADIARMAPVPHPLGSAANHATRDYLIARMTAMGLAPRIQHVPSHWGRNGFFSGGTVENLIGVLPGKSHNLPAVAMMAHYDSVPGSPGAADDAAGVSTALEVVRAIKARGAPNRDVMLIITDGEEPGLLGANAFFSEDPAAAHAGYIFNMDVRGGGGRTQMFQTAANNGDDIALYQRTAAAPLSSSLTVFIYKNMPNDTDFTVALEHHKAGLNYGFIGRQFDYHSPTSTVANLDHGAIQHLGDQIMPTVMAVAFSDRLPARDVPDAIYSALPLGLILAYPEWGGWVVLVLAAALTGVGAWRARRAKAFAWRDLWQGLGAGVLLLVGGAVLLRVTRMATGIGFGWLEGRPLLARFATFEVAMLAAAIAVTLFVTGALARGRLRVVGAAVFAAAGVGVAALGGFAMPMLIAGLGGGAVAAGLAALAFARPASVAGAWTGVLLSGFALALALQIAAPAAALVVAWPLTAAAAASALLGVGARRSLITDLVAALAVIYAVSWVGDLMHTLMQALDLPELPALTLWLGAMLVFPFAWPSTQQARPNLAAAGASLALALAISLFLAFTSPWSARYPEAVSPLYVVDHDSGQAWRAAAGPPSDWTRAVLTADGGAVTRRRIPALFRPLWAAPARPVAAAPPQITVERGADGLVTMRVALSPDTAQVRLVLKADTVVGGATLNGRPAALLTSPGKPTYLSWRQSEEPLELRFKPAGPGALDIEYAATLSHWPAEAKPLPAMPPTVMGFDEAGSTLVVGRQRAKW